MTNATKSFAARTPTGWVGVALGFGVIAVVVLLFVLSNTITIGGSRSAPLWLRAAVPFAAGPRSPG